MHLNIEGAEKKCLNLEVILQNYSINILCLTEHWLSSANIEMFYLKGFKLVSSFCRSSSIRGGSCIFTRNVTSSNDRPDIRSLSVEKVIEISCIELCEQNLVIVCLYRIPNSDVKIFMSRLENIMEILSKEPKELVINGDFNINVLERTNISCTLLDFFKAYRMRMTINFPTRTTERSSTCIDNMFTTYNEETISVLGINIDFSDHDAQAIFVKVVPRSQRDRFEWRRTINPKSIEKFKKCIKIVTWDFNDDSPNLNFVNFLRKFNLIFEETFPKKLLKVEVNKMNRSSWLTRGIKISQAKLQVLQDILISYPSSSMVDYFRRYKIIYDNVLIAAKRLSIDREIKKSENKIKAIWNVINRECRNKPKAKASVNNIIYNDITLTKPLDIANVFNHYFIEATKLIASGSQNPTINPHKRKLIAASIYLYPITAEELTICIRGLKSKPTKDIWGHSIYLIKNIALEILPALLYIYNNCLSAGVYPDEMKTTRVIPVHKKASLTDLQNYRPISLVPAFSKIFEKIIFNRITAFIDKNDLITVNQYGFRKNMSTTMALTELVKTILSALDSCLNPTGIFCDLSKAFDCVDHNILLRKLNDYGIRGKANDLIRSYLTGRKQIVDIQGTLSTPSEITRGVPQGSILGPLLFIIFINDICDYIPSSTKILLYADDTSFVLRNKNISNLLCEVTDTLNLADEWFKANKLMLNSSKTVSINFATREKAKDIKFAICGKTLSSENETKFLGITIDKALKWTSHIENVCKNLAAAIYALRKIKFLAGESAALNAYHACFHSRLSYGILIWGNAVESQRVFVLQKQAVRTILGVRRGTHCAPLFQKLKIRTLISEYVLRCLLYAKENEGECETNADRHDYYTRHRNDITLPKVRLSLFQKSFLYISFKLFRALPESTRKMSKVVLEKFLKVKLSSHPFYDIDEYFLCASDFI